MKSDDVSVLWLQNRDSSWYNHAGNGNVGQVDPYTLDVLGLPDGAYRLEWWETWKGSVSRTEEAAVVGGKLTLSMPALETDVAVKIRRAG